VVRDLSTMYDDIPFWYTFNLLHACEADFPEDYSDRLWTAQEALARRCFWDAGNVSHSRKPGTWLECHKDEFKTTKTLKDKPPEKLLEDGFSTPMPLFCLICTIISSKPCILDWNQKTNFEWAGVDTSGRVRHPPSSKKLFVRSLLIAMMYQPWELCDDWFKAWRAANKITLPAKNTLHTVAAKHRLSDWVCLQCYCSQIVHSIIPHPSRHIIHTKKRIPKVV